MKHAKYKIMTEIDFEQYGIENDLYKHNNQFRKEFNIELLIWEAKITTISYFGDIAL